MRLKIDLEAAFEKMAKKAIGVSAKTKHSRRKKVIKVQKLNGYSLLRFRKECLANEMQLSANFFNSLDFLVLFDQAKSTCNIFNVSYLTCDG